jgi:hypothetical protein
LEPLPDEPFAGLGFLVLPDEPFAPFSAVSVFDGHSGFTQMRHGPRRVWTTISGEPHVAQLSPVGWMSPLWGKG